MASPTQTPQTRMTLLKHKRELVKRARKIAAKGGYAGFDAVRFQYGRQREETMEQCVDRRGRCKRIAAP